MPKIDHGISQGFKCVVQLTNAFESDQETAEFVFPPEHAFNGIEAFTENLRIEQGFAPALRLLRPRGSGFILGVMPLLKINLRFLLPS